MFSLSGEQYGVTLMFSLSGERYGVTLKFKSSHVGCYQATLVFEFRSSLDSPPFHMVRFIEGMHTSPLVQALAPIAPFTPRRIDTSQHANARVEEGLRPDRWVISASRLAL